jgi:hypothetical protein
VVVQIDVPDCPYRTEHHGFCEKTGCSCSFALLNEHCPEGWR